MAETIENHEVFVDLMGNELREVSRMVSEVSGPSITMEAVLGEALSWGPYVTLLVRCRKDPASLASATLLFLQAKGVKVSLAGVKEYIDTAIQRCGVVPQADGIVEMFTAAVQMLATFMMGSDTAELVQKTPLWSNAMRVAHWLLLGPLHLMLGGIGGVKRLTEFYDSVFPSGSGLVSVVTSITALFKAVWEYGLPVLTGKMTLSEALARNQAFAWLVECQEAIVNCSDYGWLQERGYLSETTQALTIEFEQYVATLRTQGKLHAAAYATSSGTLFTQVVAMEKQLCLLASRIRALRTGIENKVQPVCIVLLSVPGCQKSTFQMLILRMVWDCLYPGCKFDNSMVASVNPAATRLDNVNGQTRILVIDDAAQYNLEYTKNPIVANPMNFVNTVPTMLDQAEITRKGTEMMNHQAVLINSNTRSMQILRINTCPQAAFRRIWRTLVIAPKNGAKVGSHAVGRVLSIEEMNTMYDFSVEQYDFSGGEINVKNVFSGRKVCTVRKDADSEMVTIHTDESKSFAECVAYLKTNLESYLEVQRAVVTQKEVILAEELCGLCGNVDKLCVCKKEPTAEELDDGSGVGTSIVPAVPQMRETLLTGVLGSAAAVVGLGLLVGPVRRKVVKKVTDVTDTVSTLANEAIGTMRSVADLANAAKCILESAKTEFASFKADMRRKAFATLQYSLQVGCVVLLVGAVFVGVRRFFFKAVVPQAMEAFTSVGFVPPLNTHKWPKGVHTPYVYNPHEPNALKAKVPMNKTLSILEKVEANLVIVYVATGDVKARHVYGLALGPGRILLTYHIFRGMEGVRLVLVSDRNKGGLSNTRTLMLDMSRDVFQIGEKDYCIIAVGTSSYYPVTCFPAKGGKDMEVQANVYRYDENTLEDIRGTSHLEYCKRPNGLGVASEGYSYTAMAPYGDGACGTIITTSVLGPPYVVGLHSLGEYDGSYGWTEALYDFEVEAVMKKMDLGSSPMAGLRYSGKFNGEERDGADHPHGRTIFPHVQGFGSYEANFKTLRTTDQASSFERTPLFEKVREVTGMKLDIPNLKARVEDGDTYVDPLLRAAVLNSSPPGDFDPELLDKCFDDYFDDLEAIPGFDWEQVGFLSLDQALNGEPAAVNSINFASAAGPWVGRKKRDHVTGEPGSYKLDETMQKAIDSILCCWDECESAGIMYSMKQKDEPRNENKMPRVFSAGPFAETILTRMLFGGFYEYVKKFRGKTEHAVGINCGDPVQWDEVIQAFGGLDTMVECQDASDFDLRNRMAPHVPYQILRRWRMRIGHKWSSLDDLTKKMFHYAHCLAREQFFFLRSYRGEVVLQSANQPSGRSYTTEVNSMCTSVYERMYFYTGARMKDDLASWQEVFARWKFAKYIKLLDFGDDYLKHNKDCDWYTMELRLALARNLGMEYSMPDKESAMTLLPLRKAEFLKRGFGYVNDVAVAPLDMKSILKSFAFFRRSGSLTKRQAMEEAALNAHAQLYMHGREVYEEKSKLIKEWLESLRGHPDYGNVVDDVYPVEDHGLGYDKLLELHKAGQYNETATGVAPQSGLVDLSTLIVKISDMNHNFDGISGMPDYAAASGVTAVDGVSDSGVPRSVANAVEQPATVQMPAPLAVHHLGHGTIHGNSVAQYHDSLSEFLTRPVKIATFATTIGATSNVNPWALFLLNPLVYEKIKAFAFIRGTLHIRFVMSASQFVQGRVYVGYNPAGARDDLVFDRSSSITTMSHLPYAGYIDPGIANDVEWSIPYHESRPYTPVFEVSSMGGQLYSRVAVPYENANTGTPSATNISVLAWMTDVELVVAAQPQSAKSASGGMMSKALIAASGGLQAAAKLVDAKNVSTAFHAVGDALSAFGFTREIDTRDHMPVRLRFTSGWAATEGAEASYPLTADPLAEKTVATDYAIGVEEDELIVAKMAGRYSYVDSLSWTESSSTLEQYYVTPINAGYSCVWAASAPFAYWRGSMKYKFSAVRTMFHKGKLLVKWSPGVLAADSSLNTGYSVIWDLDATPEIEILIPYNLDSYWSKTGFSTETGYQSSNGFLSLYVLEPLTGPSDVLSVPIHVFIAGGPDFAVSCPTLSTINNLGFGQDGTGVFTTASGGEAFPLKTAAGRDDPVYPQAGESDFSLEPNMFVLGPPSSCKEAALRSMGEQTVSFRELLKRKQRALTWPNVTTEMKFISTYPKSALALVSFPGGVGTLTTSPYDVTLMSYLMAMFMGISGSTKWDIVPAGATNLAYVMRGFGHPSISYSITAPETGQHGTLQGGIASRADFDGVVSVVSPQYIRGQFSYIANYYQDRYLGSQAPTSTATLETQDNGFFASSNAGAGLVLTACVAAGDDFNLLYFLGPPTPLTIVA